MKLSLLDQSPIYPDVSPEAALHRTARLAEHADRLGYHRFWVSEHHGSDEVTGSSPEVLLAYLAARTERIRLGSGGVMLQHYPPYKVAENFNVLAALAPGRIDLGIGRAPGGLPLSTRALQQGQAEARTLKDKLSELKQFVHNGLAPDHPLAGLRAMPVVTQPADLYMLGTSTASAELAAERGEAYVFAYFINHDAEAARAAIRTYRERFAGSDGRAPYVILAFYAVAGETDDEAERLAERMRSVRVRLEDGRVLSFSSMERAEAFGRQSGVPYALEEQEVDIVKGSGETVRVALQERMADFGADECMLVLPIQDIEKKLRAIEIIREACMHPAL